MKHLLHLLIALFITTFLYAQAPQKMTYQAIMRDATSTLIQNKNVGIRISILQGTPTGTAVYSETHAVSTNANGLVTIEVGGGSSPSATFNSINWSKGPYFIKTEVDPTGGSNYTISGSSQLLSVPYALYAATSGSSTGSTAIIDSLTSTSATSALSANQGSVLKSMIDKISGSSSKLTGDVTSNGSTTKVVKLQGNTVAAEAPVVGQTLQYNGLVWTPSTLSLTGDVTGTYNSTKVTQLQNIPVAVTAPATGQTLRFNGVAWIPDYPFATNVQVYPQIPGIYATNVQDALYQLKQQIVVAAGGGITSVYHDGTMSGSGIPGSPLGLADGAITNTKLAEKSVSLLKLTDISANTLLGRSTSGTGSPEAITIGSGLTLNGGVLSASGAGTGTITGVTANSGLTGGGTSGNITLGLDMIPANTILGNNTTATATPTPISLSALKTMIGTTKTDLGLGNVDNTSDKLKPVSDATQSALDLKEDKINKSTDGTLSSNSDTKYPSEKAVKTYVDSKVISGGGGISSVTHDTSLSGSGTSADPLLIPNQAISLSKMANMSSNYIIGRSSSGNGQPEYVQIGTGLSLSGGSLSANGVTAINVLSPLISAGTSGTVTIGMDNIAPNTILGNNTSLTQAPFAITASALKSMINITKADIGLGNVDNTKDIDKIMSTATQAYIDSKVPTYNTSTDANKVLTVNSTGTGVIWATPASGGGSSTGGITGVSIVTANGFQGSASSGAVPNITLGTSVTGLLKGNGATGAVTAATPGTDYLLPTMTANKLLGSGLSGTSATEITLGTNLSFTGNTLNATGGSASAATTSALGTIQLAGDLGGTATAPTVPGLTAKAPLASPAFTGTPTAPTAAAGTNTTQIATTAFVLANAGGAPATTSALGTVQLAGDLGGTATAPTVPGLTAKAPLASPAFTGTPTAPTATAGTNTTQIATTAFVLANAGGTPATTSALGTVQLAGDLGGTATAPTIAASAVTTTKIAANAVTYAKMQAMTANKLLGSGLSGTAVSEVTLGSGLSFTGTTLNSIAPTPAGTDAGKVLTANASGSATWQTASGGGSGVSTASNGLTVTSGDVALGGTLTKNTTIDQGANTLTFTNTGLSGSTGRTIFNGTTQNNGAVYVKNGSNIRFYTGVDTDFSVNDQDFIIVINGTSATSSFQLPLPSAASFPGRMLIIRSTNKPLQYMNVGAGVAAAATLATNKGQILVSDGTCWMNVAN